MIQPKKTKHGTWQVRWREKGVQRAKAFRRKELALKFAYELSQGKEHEENVRMRWLTFAEYARTWHENYCKIEKDEIQWFDDLSIINTHLVPAFGQKRLSNLAKADLLSLRRNLIEHGKSPKTVNNIAGLAKKMMNVAVDWGYLSANPWDAVKPLKIPERPFAYWMQDERDRFLRFAKRECFDLYEVVAVACHTGLRLGEMMGLKRDALDFERRVIVVHRSYSVKLKKLKPYTKSKRVRQVPMNDLVFEILSSRRLMAPDDFVFDHELAQNTPKRMRSVARKAGVKRLRFHDLRHTFASNLAMAGMALHKIQAVLGHANYKETERYAHLHPDALDRITDCLVHEVCTAGEKVAEVVGIKG